MIHRRFLSISIAGALFLGLPLVGSAFADEDPAAYEQEEHPRTEPELPDESRGDVERSAEAEAPFPDFAFQGWVDSAIIYDNLDSGQNNKVGFDFAQVGLRMSHAINENYGGFVQLNAFGGARELDLVAREAYGYYQTDGGGFRLLAGKYYAPIGFELADPPDLYQFSNSLVFDNLIPTELVGALAALQITDHIDLQVYVSGPWDDDAAAMSMGGKNFGTRLGVGFGELGGIGFSAVGGPQDPSDEGLLRIAYDVDLALTPADGLLIGAEANMNMIHQRLADNEKAFVNPYGFLVMTNYEFTDLFNLTLRYDMLVDAPVGDAGEAPGAPIFMPVDGSALTRSSFTVAPNLALAPGWDIFTEVRYDMASEDAFMVDGEAASGFVSTAVELIYQF